MSTPARKPRPIPKLHADTVEIINFLRDDLMVNLADVDWAQAEKFIDAAVTHAATYAVRRQN